MSGLPFMVCIAVKLLPCTECLGCTMLLSTFLASRTTFPSMCAQYSTSISSKLVPYYNVVAASSFSTIGALQNVSPLAADTLSPFETYTLIQLTVH